MQPTIKIILDQRRTKKEGVFPVKLRVTHNRIQLYYPCDRNMSEGDFNEVMYSPKPRKAYKEIALELNAIAAKATAISAKLKYFSFEEFEKLYYGPTRSVDIFGYYKDYMAQLKEEGRPGTEENYETSMNSIQRFLKHQNKKNNRLAF